MDNNRNVFIYWDFDDVLGKTHAQMIYLLKYLFNHDALTDVYLTPANTDGHLGHILDSANFMCNTALDYPAWRCLNGLREYYPGIKHGLATHRGYHPDGERNTLALLKEYEHGFDSYHFIDPALCGKDKMAYLRALHADDDVVILIDDNTFYEHDAYPNSWTVLVDRPWNKHVVTTDPDLRVTTSGIYQAVSTILENLRLGTPAYERAT